MRKLFITLTVATILLGVIALSLNFIFGGQVVTYINTITINDVTMYKLDLFSYTKNLEQTITNTPMIILTMPSREWKELSGNILDQQMWQDLGNNMAYIIDIIIAAINILLFPVRLAAYIMQIVLSIIGLPMTNYDYNPLKWLIDFMKTLTQFELPYTPV